MTGKSSNPAYPDAHPTAPGGMSQKALVAELMERHGYDERSAKQMTWPQQIEAVIEQRKAREAEARCDLHELLHCAECSGEGRAHDESLSDDSPDTNDMFSDEDADDLDALLAEFDLADKAVLDAHLDARIAAGEPGLDEDKRATSSTGQPEMPVHPDDCEKPCCAGPMAEQSEMEVDADDMAWLDPEALFAEMTQAREAEQASQPAPLFIGLPKVRDYIFDGHAGAGPSGAERWMNCTMSLSASRAFLETLTPNQQRAYAGAGSAARQGTTAHAAAEAEANLVLGRVSQEEVNFTLMELTVEPETEAEAYDDEMAEYITEYVDLIRSYAQDRGDEHVLIEARVEAAIPLTDLHEGEVYVIRGSADCAVLPAKTDTELVVGDLKYGSGIDVDVDENPQVRIYALGVLGLLADPETGEFITNVEKVTYHIVQPRLGGIKTWTESVDELLTWRDEVLAPALTRALYGANEGATYEPSDLACQWCPARGSCPALTEARVEAASGLFDTIVESEFENGPGTFPETTSLTDTRLGELLTMIIGLTGLKDDLKAEAQRRLHRGGTVPGFQLVSYTPSRKWKDGALDAIVETEDLADEERDLLFKPTALVTPTQAEKALGKETYSVIEALVVKPDKVPIIAPEGDRRKPWTGTPPEQMFADESQTGDTA